MIWHNAIALKVIHIDGRLGTSHERLQFLLIEHAQPLRIDDVGEATEECFALRCDLTIELVITDELDVCGNGQINNEFLTTPKSYL